tara:strand:- start:443 stop:913 length:471 start_codon:yes stop_codon:yes gene_type:complete
MRATKTLYLYFIKNLIKSDIFILVFISTFLLISCSISKEDQAYLLVQDLYCSSTKTEITIPENKYLISSDKDFQINIKNINTSYLDKNYNLMVISGIKPSSGYSLELEKVIKKNLNNYFYFKNIKPKKNSKILPAQNTPFCLLNIDRPEKAIIFIN